MFDQDIADGARTSFQGHTEPENSRPSLASLSTERLPFTVRLVRDESDLRKAVRIRHAAYARHVPVFAQSLTKPEDHDAASGVVILLAESKVDGSPVGTMRIQTNQFGGLGLEKSIKLPEWLSARPLAEATRLGVTEERVGRLVKTVLFKAFYQYCIRNEIEWMVVTGRFPIDRQYERLMFEEVYPGMGYVPLAHVGNLPHRIMSFDVKTAEQRWRDAMHPLFKFVVLTSHPDIDVGPQHAAYRPSVQEKFQFSSSFSEKVAVKNL